DRFLRLVAPGWRHARTVYGPLFTAASALIATIAGRSAVAARVLFQAASGLAVLVSGFLLNRAGAPRWAVPAVLLNPLLIVGVVNGGHNDALVGLFVVSAAIAADRGRPVGAGLLLAAAMGIKAPAVLAAAALAVWLWRRAGPRAAGRLLGTP